MFRRRFFANGRLVVLENTSHLVPAEKSRELIFALVLAIAGELSALSLLIPQALFLIPLTRLPGFIWLIVAGLNSPVFARDQPTMPPYNHEPGLRLASPIQLRLSFCPRD